MGRLKGSSQTLVATGQHTETLLLWKTLVMIDKYQISNKLGGPEERSAQKAAWLGRSQRRVSYSV